MECEFWQDENYLKLCKEGEESYADRLFCNRDIPGFLPLQIMTINGQKEYMYDISGKISLAQYLKQASYDFVEIKRILFDLLNLYELVEQYLLEGNGILYDEDYIFIDLQTKQIHCLYQEDSQSGGVKGFGAFLEFIMDTMNMDDERLTFFIYELQKRSKEVGMTCRMLKEYLNYEVDNIPKQNHIKPINLHSENREKIVSRNKREYALAGSAVLIAVIGVFVTGLVWWNGCFMQPLSHKTDWIKGIGFTLFFLITACYAAWKIWPKNKESDIRYNIDERKIKVCLVSCQKKIDSIPIEYFPYILGGEEKRVDAVLPVFGIAPIHAKINCEGENVYVMDEESEHGTYHNGRRLVPWQKRYLQDGDVLRFSTLEYIVEISHCENTYAR